MATRTLSMMAETNQSETDDEDSDFYCRLRKLLNELLHSWKHSSSLQKIIVIATFTLLVSFLTSQGTLMFSFVSALGGGFYISNQFLLQE